ncbi:MAG: AbrB/MazE/SpoVT family DNA-binding domain-containing protein [Propionibacteriaceae bacterium]|nr:AbrB/MazE/SpoVT family DNA-binding domain-containing protein [Propionibacteriaceae bacterium]
MADKTTPGSFPWQYMPRPGKVYGAARIGERGQIAIPADARRDLNIQPGDKLMVFGNRINGSVVLIKADVFEGFADFFMTKLNKLESTAQEFLGSFTAEAAESDGDDTAEEASGDQASRAADEPEQA